MSPDPFGRAIRDFHRGEQTESLLTRDGEETIEHPVEQFYFGEYTPDSEADSWLVSRLDGPLLDIGAGTGRHALHFQDQFETVAIEVSEHLVETMRDRGVEDARQADMFALREHFERDRFRSALANGTQLGLAKSMQGLRELLGDLAHVTTPDATAVLDGYDPDSEKTSELIGHREDPTPGLDFRLMQFEYEGDLSSPLLFRLFSPDRVREATAGTGWAVTDVRYTDEHEVHYQVALRKV